MPVSTKHPEYIAKASQWKRTRDACAGQKAIKDSRSEYLPEFEPHDQKRYDAYIKRARFLGVTGRTEEALVGAVFRNDPEIDLPSQVEYLTENADGAGEGLAQIGKRAVSELLCTGRYGFLIDYPDAPEGLTAEQVAALDLRAYIAPYRAESIINWATRSVAGKQMLSLVVLAEKTAVPVDEFESREEDQFRVLRLSDELVYSQQVYDKRGEPVTEEYFPRDFGGSVLNEIPFVFAGSKDNKPCIDTIPLSDLAETNISHYQVSADHMENLHIHGQLTLGISSNMSAAQFKEANPNGVMVGARAGHFLGEGGQFTTATAPESSSLSKALEDLKDDMVAIGGRLISPRTGNRTAEEARLESAAEMSVLETLVGNCSEAIEKCCEWIAVFMGADLGAVEFELNRDFWDIPPDPQLVSVLMGLEDRGHMAQSDIRDYLRSTGVVKPDRTDELIDQEVGEDGGIVPRGTSPRGAGPQGSGQQGAV